MFEITRVNIMTKLYIENTSLHDQGQLGFSLEGWSL